MATRFQISTVFRAVDRMTAPIRSMQNSIGKLTRSTEKRLRNISKSADKLAEGLFSVGKKAALGFVGFAAGATLINKTTTQLTAQARAVNVSVGLISSLGGALKGAGFETDNVIDLIEEMNNKLGESAALEEIAPVTEALTGLGLEFADIRDMSPEKQFRTIANAAIKLGDAQKASSLADILFGSEASKMVGVLVDQGKTIEEIIRDQQRLSFMTDRARVGAEAWTVAFNDSARIAASFGQQVAGLAGEQLAPLLAQLNDIVVANKDLINDNVTAFFQDVAEAIEWTVQNFDLVTERVKLVVKAFSAFIILTTILKTLVLVMTAVNLVMALNPIVLITAGIVLLVGALIDMVDGWDAVISVIKGTPGFIKKFIFGGDADESADAPPKPEVASPQTRGEQQRARNAETEQAELTVKTEDGTSAAITRGGFKRNFKMKMQRSGGFA